MKEGQKKEEKKSDWVAWVSAWLGALSIVLWEFSIIPILAVVFSVVAIIRLKGEVPWYVFLALVLGIIFLFVSIAKTYGVF